MKKVLFSVALYWLCLVAGAIFLYSLTAPNLVLSTWDPYWQWQLWMWETFFNNRPLLGQVYFLILSCSVLTYFLFLKTLWSSRVALLTWIKYQPRQLVIVSMVLTAPLVLGMNGLSYDVFNYAFNAKMVVQYQANPHQQVALDFSEDQWVRFMHNTHTPAPYGYGWTALSLIPYLAGMGKLLPTWLLFKLASWFSLGLLCWWYSSILKPKSEIDAWQVVAVVTNPLLLIELLMNGHNDLWMMVPALVSLWLVRSPQHKNTLSVPAMLWSLSFLLVSITIKLATIAVLPIWIAVVVLQLSSTTKFGNVFSHLRTLLLTFWPALAAVALACLLLTERSKLFLPWYWTWVLVWLPLIPAGKVQKIARSIGLGFSISSLFRYLPFLFNGEYTSMVVSQQIFITFGAGLLLSLIIFGLDTLFFQPRRHSPLQVE